MHAFSFVLSEILYSLKKQYQHNHASRDQREKKAASHDTRGTISTLTNPVARTERAKSGAQGNNTQDNQE
jgi:hypothetical protein